LKQAFGRFLPAEAEKAKPFGFAFIFLI